MPYFPFFADIENKRFVVIGGGEVAFRKVQKLLPFSPEITVIAPNFCNEILSLGVKIIKRRFVETDIENTYAVISATDDKALNEKIFKLCKAKKIPVNTVDDKENCTFIFPAIVCRNDISVGISTAGKSPLVASHIRQEIDRFIDDRYVRAVEILGENRELVKQYFADEKSRRLAFDTLLKLCFSMEDKPSAQQIKNTLESLR